MDIQSKNDQKISFTTEQYEGLKEMLRLINEALEIMLINLNSNFGKVSIEAAVAKENEINVLRNRLRKKNVKRMTDDRYDVRSSTIYSDLFHSFEKIGDHIINVSEAISGEKERDLENQLEEN